MINYCPQCGDPVGANIYICPTCGTDLLNATLPTTSMHGDWAWNPKDEPNPPTMHDRQALGGGTRRGGDDRHDAAYGEAIIPRWHPSSSYSMGRIKTSPMHYGWIIPGKEYIPVPFMGHGRVIQILHPERRWDPHRPMDVYDFAFDKGYVRMAHDTMPFNDTLYITAKHDKPSLILVKRHLQKYGIPRDELGSPAKYIRWDEFPGGGGVHWHIIPDFLASPVESLGITQDSFGSLEEYERFMEALMDKPIEGFNTQTARLKELSHVSKHTWSHSLYEVSKFKVGDVVSSPKDDIYAESDDGYILIPAKDPVEIIGADESKYRIKSSTGTYDVDKSFAESKFKKYDEDEPHTSELDATPSHAPLGGGRQESAENSFTPLEAYKNELRVMMEQGLAPSKSGYQSDQVALAPGNKVIITSIDPKFTQQVSLGHIPTGVPRSSFVGQHGWIVSSYALGPNGPVVYRVSTNFGDYDFLDKELKMISEGINDELSLEIQERL